MAGYRHRGHHWTRNLDKTDIGVEKEDKKYAIYNDYYFVEFINLQIATPLKWFSLLTLSLTQDVQQTSQSFITIEMT